MIDTITEQVEKAQAALQTKNLRILKYPRFWFIVLGYPFLFLLYYHLRKWLTPILLLYPLEMGFVVYLACSVTCIMTLFTVANKLLRRDLQGQKLQIRERQGINLKNAHGEN